MKRWIHHGAHRHCTVRLTRSPTRLQATRSSCWPQACCLSAYPIIPQNPFAHMTILLRPSATSALRVVHLFRTLVRPLVHPLAHLPVRPPTRQFPCSPPYSQTRSPARSPVPPHMRPFTRPLARPEPFRTTAYLITYLRSFSIFSLLVCGGLSTYPIALRSLTLSPISCSPARWFVRPIAHSFTYPLVHALTHLLAPGCGSPTFMWLADTLA